MRVVFAGENEATGEVVNGWTIETRPGTLLAESDERKNALRFERRVDAEIAIAGLHAHGIDTYDDFVTTSRETIVRICRQALEQEYFFTCPICGGHFFGRDPDTFLARCHGSSSVKPYRKCDWEWEWNLK